MPDPISAIVGSSVLGAGASIFSGNAAADAQTSAANSANQTAMSQFLINREDMAPWREAGIPALKRLSTGLVPGGEFDRRFTFADFKADPGYGFRRSEGEKGINRSLLSRGKGLSGAGLKAGIRFNSDFASKEFGKARSRFNEDQAITFNRLSALSGTSQDTTQRGASEGTRLAELMGENVIGAGNSRAASYANTGSAINNSINQGMSLYGRFNGWGK